MSMKNRSQFGSGTALDRRPPGPDENFEVEGDGKSVTLNLGMAPSFSLPNSAAIQLACLILKKAGVEVSIDSFQRSPLNG